MKLQEILKLVPIFSQFNSEELKIIEELLTSKAYNKDEIIFEENMFGDEMYILVTGIVGVFKQNENGESIQLSKLNKMGTFFGEMALFDGRPRSATIKALDSVELLILNRKDMFKTLESNPTVFIKMFEELSIRFREFNEKYYSDITEKNRLLEALNKKLKKLDEMKSKFINLASHELKTPLNSILNAAQIIADQKQKMKDHLENDFLDIIVRNSEKLDTLITNIFLLSQIKEPDLVVERHPINISRFFEEIVKEIAPFIEPRKHKFKVSVDASLPLLYANEIKIFQCVLQLLFNAIKFTEDNGCIELYAKDSENDIVLGVIDTGIGIPKENLDDIFEFFYEVNDCDSHFSGKFEFMAGGLGIGLSIAKLAAKIHNGKINVESTLGKGSHFSLSLPKIHNAVI